MTSCTPRPCSSTERVAASTNRDCRRAGPSAPRFVSRRVHVSLNSTPTTRQRRWIDLVHRPPIAIDRVASGRPLLARRGSRSCDLDRVYGQCPRQPGTRCVSKTGSLIPGTGCAETFHGPSRCRVSRHCPPGRRVRRHVDTHELAGANTGGSLWPLTSARTCSSVRLVPGPSGTHQRSLSPC